MAVAGKWIIGGISQMVIEILMEEKEIMFPGVFKCVGVWV